MAEARDGAQSRRLLCEEAPEDAKLLCEEADSAGHAQGARQRPHTSSLRLLRVVSAAAAATAAVAALGAVALGAGSLGGRFRHVLGLDERPHHKNLEALLAGSDLRLLAYLDEGSCGPVGDDHNLEAWCNGYEDLPCRERVDVDPDLCASGRATLKQTFGQRPAVPGAAGLGAFRCTFFFLAQYECLPLPGEAPAEVGIPKILYTFWAGEAPKFIQWCWDNWRRANVGWELRVLNETSAAAYFDDSFVFDDPRVQSSIDSPARMADFVRLTVLSKTGGVWADASILFRLSLDQLLSSDWFSVHVGAGAPGTRAPTFYGYFLRSWTTDDRFPVLESWFFACTKGDPFVAAWRDAFNWGVYDPRSWDELVDEVRNHTDLQGIDLLPYTFVDAAAQVALQRQGASHSLQFSPAEDGPYEYLAGNGWDTKVAVSALLTEKVHGPLVKINSCVRDELLSRDQDFQDQVARRF